MRDLLAPPDRGEREDLAYGLLRRHDADLEHGPLPVDGPTRIVDPDDGRTLGAYLPIPDTARTLVEEFRALCPRLPLSDGYRSDGVQTRASMFGYRPRLPLQGIEFCGPCAFNRTQPDAIVLLQQIGEMLLPVYEGLVPDVYAAHVEQSHTIGDQWHFVGPYTAGIFNRNNPLRYHRDTGNLAGSWNLQIVLREQCDGGELVVPGWAAHFACADASLLLFDAGRTTHGVAPIRRRRRDGWRCSVVYYSITQMRNCLPPEDELLLAQKRRTEREGRRARRLLPDQEMPA